jgi:DNA-directed RNA polymerase, mitochondrial
MTTIDPAEHDRLLQLERELELEMLDRGVARYRDSRQARPSHQGIPERRFMVEIMDPFVAAITAYREKILNRECPAVKHGKDIWPAFIILEPEQIALAVLSTIFDAAYQRASSLQAMVQIIGANLEVIAHLKIAKKTDSLHFRLAQRQIRKQWNKRTAQRFLKMCRGTQTIWPAQQKRLIGAKCLSLLLDSTDILDLHVVPSKYATIQIKEDLLTLLDHEHEQLELLRPFLMPMVIPPADWEPDQDSESTKPKYRGGYIYHNYPLIKSQNWGDVQASAELSDTALTAINAIQRTGFQINWRVYNIQRHLWELGGGRCGLPPRDLRPLPERDVDPDDPDDLAAYRNERRLAWHYRRQDVSARISQLYRCVVIDRLQTMKVPAFYFVWSFDWRGRMYPVTTTLSPQGSDLDRGILQFAEAIPQTPEGRYWLKVHAANCWGEDKIPFDERVAWTSERMDRVLQVAQDPLAHSWWMKADKPFMFLAACFELCRTDGMTQLPVFQDGSCNGLQHLSAMGRDEYGGQFVNLLPADRPQDIYQRVADLVQKSYEACDSRLKEEFPPITRTLVKRAVMTYPYSVTVAGITDQFLMDGHLDHVKRGADKYIIAQQLTVWVWEAIQKVVLKGAEIMSWLRQMADITNQEGLPIVWTTPAGMTIEQRYLELVRRRVALPGLTNTLWFLDSPGPEREKLRKRKQRNGIAPNFVHSFDASHLMLTLARARAEGITSFSPVHDSYGTHAPHYERMGRILREEFIAMYQEDHLRKLWETMQAATGKDIPPPPAWGDLDLGVVAESDYFFS